MIYISVVSHGHFTTLNEINILPKLKKLEEVSLVVLDNIGEPSLHKWCNSYDITYIVNEEKKGFSSNNNSIFNYFDSNYTLNDNDYFLILNPDVYISDDDINLLIQMVSDLKPMAFTIDLFKDFNYQIRDPFIRKFPKFLDFIKSYLLGVNNTIIDRSNCIVDDIDWCAGSFMCFDIKSYRSLKGFDEGYFMYCEDIDICFRAKHLGVKIQYFSDIKAVHLAQHTNRKILSKHFFWHIKSIVRFLLKANTSQANRFFYIKNNSNIK